jgi:hypothetical protein
MLNVSDSAVPPLVHLRIWRVPMLRLPQALARMATGRRTVRRTPGVRFAKLLGTGSGETFTTTDADLSHWAMLTVFDSSQAADDFSTSPQVHAWDRIANESIRLDLRPLSSKGRWSGQNPFPVPQTPARWDGPVAALTRARIKPQMWRRFWSSVPPVATDLQHRTGVVLSLGIGEAPIGLQGTFSVWESNRALTEFAQRGEAHRAVINDTERLEWYSEELFARFSVLGSSGSFNGVTVPFHTGGTVPFGPATTRPTPA